MQGCGARLKKIRLEKGITLEEAHKKTKIHLDILRAIEEDNFINLSPVYLRGFLKIYCNFLSVEPRDFISDYKETKTTVKASPEKEKADNALLDEPATKTVSPRTETTKKIIKIIFIAIVFITAANILFNLGRILVQKISARKARRPAAIAAKVPSRKEKTLAVAAKAASPVVAPKTKEVVSGIRLAIRARANSWMQVKSDGKVVFQAVLKKGRSETWEAKNKIELSLGNVGVLDLEINSKPIPSLGRKGQSLKNVLITKEGLSIKR